MHVAVLRPDGSGFARPFWHVFAVAEDAARVRSIRFPVGITDGNPRGAAVFVYDRRTDNEASSEEEESRGRIAFARVGCTLGTTIRFTVSGTLGSEISQQPSIRVSGTYEGMLGKRPPWWPG